MAEKEGTGNRVAWEWSGSRVDYRPALIVIGYWRQVIWIPEDAEVWDPIRIEVIEIKDRV